MNWLNYHHLYYFFIIAKEGGVAKAAKHLRLGQPALSTQLRQLEAALGYPLFERRNRSLILTERGKILYEYSTEIFRLGREMLEAANDQLPERQVHFQIGALDSLPKVLVHRLVEAAYQIGECYVSVLEGGGERLFSELAAHRVDLVLTNSTAPLSLRDQFQSKLVAEMRVIICGSPKYAGLKRNFPQSLNDQPFVLPTGDSRLRQDILQYFESHSIRIKPIGETQDSEVQKLMALSGRALIPIAEPAVKANLKNRSLVRIATLDHLVERLWLTKGSRKVQNPIAAKLMKTFRID